MAASFEIAVRDFGKALVRKLGKQGVEFVGMQPIPDMTSPMPWANAQRGYVVSDNGTGRVLTYSEVKALAQ